MWKLVFSSFRVDFSKTCLLLISQPDSYRIAAYLKTAKQMGVEVMIASQGEFSLVSEVHEGLHIELNDMQSAYEKILKVANKTPFNGILGCDDSTVELAAKVANTLALPHNPASAARLTYRKDLARAVLAKAHCPVPEHHLLNLTINLERQMQRLPCPCVIKPLNMSASRGVIRANNAEEFIQACHRIKAIIASSQSLFERTHVLVEQYIDGSEVAYEGYLHEGELTSLALFDKPDPLEGPFFAETIYVTPSQLGKETQALIKKRVFQATQAYGLTTGPIHAELRIDENDAWILEVACRTIGGDCARTLDNGTDFNLEQLIISLAMGRPVKAKLAEEARGVMMLPVTEAGILKRVEGLSAARQVENIEKVDVIIREGHELIPLPEGNQYAGYIFAKGATADEVVMALRLAYAQLKLVVALLFKIKRC
ncbi:MAG: ATP-grasp domain-containing protein [Methylococcales symbiont of Hymedesmia sp. n. MRB-2018]|nr:MAG: ATP-grasp domain-containing protein [Methylococcales symbiont of Hymedesmia sp. n. MRB-2018]KAF3983903.1 MAG: ATP-grasp domain-containing protein [Methylococcales symbiont of Hymedesmia sp. n. MRB-2018]